MNSIGIMWRARRRILVFVSTMFVVTVGFAQTQPARSDDDLDVTMRVIVDPDAKVPDEIVRRIALPKPQQPSGTPPPSDKQNEKPDKTDDPNKPGEKDKGRPAEPPAQGREFGQQTAEQAKQRADEARRNNDKPPKPPKPPNPPGPPNQPRGGPG